MLHTQALLSNACVVGAQQCKPSWWVTSVACFTYLYIPATHTHPCYLARVNEVIFENDDDGAGNGADAQGLDLLLDLDLLVVDALAAVFDVRERR